METQLGQSDVDIAQVGLVTPWGANALQTVTLLRSDAAFAATRTAGGGTRSARLADLAAAALQEAVAGQPDEEVALYLALPTAAAASDTADASGGHPLANLGERLVVSSSLRVAEGALKVANASLEVGLAGPAWGAAMMQQAAFDVQTKRFATVVIGGVSGLGDTEVAAFLVLRHRSRRGHAPPPVARLCEVAAFDDPDNAPALHQRPTHQRYAVRSSEEIAKEARRTCMLNHHMSSMRARWPTLPVQALMTNVDRSRLRVAQWWCASRGALPRHLHHQQPVAKLGALGVAAASALVAIACQQWQCGASSSSSIAIALLGDDAAAAALLLQNLTGERGAS